MSKDLDRYMHDDVQGIYLLFKNGKRPSILDIYRFTKLYPSISVSFDPGKEPAPGLVASGARPDEEWMTEHDTASWLELLSDGLTFDIIGLAPGDYSSFPTVAHGFDFDRNQINKFEHAIRLNPGAHVSGAEGAIPVLKTLLGLARDLIQHFEQIEAVVWPPSGSVIGRRFFESTVSAYLEGGAFPALGLIAFQEALDGGLQSVGLAHIIGQELRIEPDLVSDKVVATRLAVRLINQLILTGTVDRREDLVSPDGRIIHLEPSGNARFVRVLSE